MKALRLGALMFLNYGLNAVSIRMLAKGSYLGLGLSDAALACWGFTMIRHVARAETRTEQLGYVVGGVCGSLLGLYCTR